MFFTNCTLSIIGERTNDAWELNDKQAPYNTVIEALSIKSDILNNICNILGSYDRWYDKDPDMDELLLNSDNARTITHYVKVRLFGILYWWATIDPAIAATYFNDYYVDKMIALEDKYNLLENISTSTSLTVVKDTESKFIKVLKFIKKLFAKKDAKQVNLDD